jgi:hypothetical protein
MLHYVKYRKPGVSSHVPGEIVHVTELLTYLTKTKPNKNNNSNSNSTNTNNNADTVT